VCVVSCVVSIYSCLLIGFVDYLLFVVCDGDGDDDVACLVLICLVLFCLIVF